MKYLTYTNYGCIDLCKNMIQSLIQNGGVSQEDIFVHCFDDKSLESLKHLPGAYMWKRISSDLEEYKNWSFDPGSEFCSIVSWKWKIIREFYQRNKEFIFCDSDIFFIKNPEEDLKSYSKNICIQCDHPGSTYCTGFIYLNESPETSSVINHCANNHMDDQIVLNNLVNSNQTLRDKIQLLEINKYANGHHYYKQGFDRSGCIMVHNNHMVGKETKVNRFKDEKKWLI